MSTECRRTTFDLETGARRAHNRVLHLKLIGSRDGRDGSLVIHQDMALYAAVLADGERVEHTLAKGRRSWAQVTRGSVQVNGETLGAGDGAAMTDELAVAIVGQQSAEVLLFDLP